MGRLSAFITVRSAFLMVTSFVALAASALPVHGATADEAPRLVVKAEVGPVWQSRNDVQIPNDGTGTRFSLSDLLGSGAWPAGRLYVTWNAGARHSVRALAAPLSITETGELAAQTAFAGATFEPGVPTDATYRFNSWRLTYAYLFHRTPRWSWSIGFTAKLRDAKVELSQGQTSAKKTDLGFVPLLHVSGAYRLSPTWRLALDVDALAGGPGRAVDASLELYMDVDERWSLSAGYRTVEGGADVDEVYNFAWLHYLVSSVTYRY